VNRDRAGVAGGGWRAGRGLTSLSRFIASR